jgi:4-hydroxy-tetrahydrodipicolinate synthase
MLDPAAHQDDISGVWVDVLTPLKTDFSVDAVRLCAHVRNLCARGVQRLTVFGHAGEGACFSGNEKLDALRHLIASGVSPQDLMLGVSATTMADAVQLIRSAHDLGIQRFLVAPPLHYQPIGQAAMLEFFQQLIRQVNVSHWQLYVHQLGGASRLDVPEATLNELKRAFPSVVRGVVDQDVHPSHTLDLMRAFRSELIVIPTCEANLVVVKPTVVLSAFANLIPLVIKHLLSHDLGAQTTVISGMKVRKPDDRVTELMAAIGDQPTIAALKLFLSLHFHQAEWALVRPPLMRISPNMQESLLKAFKNYNLLASE